MGTSTEVAEIIRGAHKAIRQCREGQASAIAWAIAREIYGAPVPDSATRNVERLTEAIQDML